MEVILTAIPALFIVGIICLIIASNKRINKALFDASETLGFTYISSKNIFRKKRIFGELDGYNCEVEVYTRSHGKSSTTYVSFPSIIKGGPAISLSNDLGSTLSISKIIFSNLIYFDFK